ncbi:MAG: hypothetical protein KAH54_02425 [Candidatus Sabulitectum sp.]|nr:hypothetical protein [Candidatus Sabulitectum sp.]
MLALLVLILSNPAEDYTADPFRVFALSDSVLSAINSVEYSFAFSGTGALSNIIPHVQGTTSLGQMPGVSHPLMFHNFESLTRDGIIHDLKVPSAFVATAESVYFVDHDDSLVYFSDYSTTANNMFNFPPASLLMEYVIPSPFADEILAESIAVLEPVYKNGTMCHVFHVFYRNVPGTEVLWFVGMDDLLPRAVERMSYYGPTSTPGGQLLEITDIAIGTPLPSAPSIADGYTFVKWKLLLDPGTDAPSFFLADRDGLARRSSDFGDRAILLCFFSSWDPLSLSTLGFLKSMEEQYSETLQAVGISIRETGDPEFRLSSLGIDFPVLVFGEDAAVVYNVHSVPSVFLVSEDGVVLYSCQSVTGYDESAILALLEDM